MEHLGRVAYEAYGRTVNWMTVNGQEMPQWDEQRASLRAAWHAAAQAVADRVIGAMEGETDTAEEG